MRRIVFQKLEVFSGDGLRSFWKAIEVSPEASGSAMHLQILEGSFGLIFAGLTYQEIELPSLRIGFDLSVPPLPLLFR
jgi:hypothetical protein